MLVLSGAVACSSEPSGSAQRWDAGGGDDVGEDADVAAPEDVGDDADDVDNGGERDAGESESGDIGDDAPHWESRQGYEVSGVSEVGGPVVIGVGSAAVRFGEKPGGGPALLWDFGDEVYVRGQAEGFNAALAHGQEVEGSPLYGRESPRANPVYQREGEGLRYPGGPAHYLGPAGGGQGDRKSGAYFMGVAATGGKTGEPTPFRDGRYYYASRVRYPGGQNDNSLKTMRGSQRDSLQEGWGGSAAGNIGKNQWQYSEGGTLVFPPPLENGYRVPVWSSLPEGDLTRWHLEEMFIDPTGDTEPGMIFNQWQYWFADTGRQLWLPAMNLGPGDEELGRYTPTTYWDATRGFYHQVGPEPAGYEQSDYTFGEVYIDDSWRRVVLTDGAEYLASTQVELQRIVSWSDTRIEVVLNPGAFRKQEGPLYLHWIDPSNVAHLAGVWVR
ncbi:hypothetical protein DL240_13190 [Lujinxingia litoralis]|uniref:Uncharacterized protein n=2 Tax=Lujinxingia litoralis TaxID=2211119 RepID=A0A328C674_9DELT|nr:hypothetical protein DL240_13190 [Lujinxingia litoralis]